MPLPSNYTQTATHWGVAGRDEFDEIIFDAPVEVLVRWEQKQELFMDNQGKQVLSNAIVYPLEELPIEGYLALGSFSETNPKESSLTNISFEIKMQSIITNIKNTKEIIKVWL